MKLSVSFNKETLPLFVWFLLIIKVLHVGFLVFFTDVSTTANEMLTGSMYMADSLTWLPMLLFFLYFYLYRAGKISNDALKLSIIAALLSIIPKSIVLVMLVVKYKSIDLNETLIYLLELVAWLFMFAYMIVYWKGNFKLKEHHHHHHSHHHHHHHHSSDEKVVVERKNSKLGTYEHHHHHHHHHHHSSHSDSSSSEE